MKRLFVAIAACAALSACGGDAGGGLDGAYMLQRDVKPYDVEMEGFVFSPDGKVGLTISESNGNGGRSSRVETGTYTVEDGSVVFKFGYSSTFGAHKIDGDGCLQRVSSDRYCKA